MLDGWISSGAYGSSLTRPDSISALMSRSERSTLATYRVRYDVWANTAQPGRWRPRQGGVGVRGGSSMVERQLPKLIVRVRFPSPAPRQKPRSGDTSRVRALSFDGHQLQSGPLGA